MVSISISSLVDGTSTTCLSDLSVQVASLCLSDRFGPKKDPPRQPRAHARARCKRILCGTGCGPGAGVCIGFCMDFHLGQAAGSHGNATC